MFHMVIISIIRASIWWLFVWSRNEKLVILPSCICLLRYFHATFRTIKIILLIYHAREFKTLSTDYRQLRHNSAVSVSFRQVAPLIPGAAKGRWGLRWSVIFGAVCRNIYSSLRYCFSKAMLLRFQRNLGSRNRHKKRVFGNGHVRDLSSLTCHCYGII